MNKPNKMNKLWRHLDARNPDSGVHSPDRSDSGRRDPSACRHIAGIRIPFWCMFRNCDTLIALFAACCSRGTLSAMQITLAVRYYDSDHLINTGLFHKYSHKQISRTRYCTTTRAAAAAITVLGCLWMMAPSAIIWWCWDDFVFRDFNTDAATRPTPAHFPTYRRGRWPTLTNHCQPVAMTIRRICPVEMSTHEKGVHKMNIPWRYVKLDTQHPNMKDWARYPPRILTADIIWIWRLSVGDLLHSTHYPILKIGYAVWYAIWSWMLTKSGMR